MPQELTNDNKIRLYILYMMDGLGEAMDYARIYELALAGAGVTYFDFTEIFGKMARDGEIEAAPGTGEPLYSVTARGRLIAENLSHLLPAPLRESGYAASVRARGTGGAAAAAGCTLTEEGDAWILSCRVGDAKKPLLEMNLRIGEQAVAEKAARLFGERADVIYKGVLAMLTGDAEFLFG